MDQRELEKRIKNLNSAVNANDNPSTIIAILESLKKDVVPTEELLRATRAGVVVARQRASKDKDIARLASEIVAKWKKHVEAAKSKKSVPKMPASASPAPGTAPSPAPPTTQTPTAAPGKGYTGDPATRKHSVDGVETKRTGIPSRDNCIGLLYDGLAYMCTEPSNTILLKAIEIERCAFEEYGGDTGPYRTKLRSLFQNLKNKQNRELSPKVLSGEIPAQRFVTMTHEEMKSNKMKEEDAKLEKENIKNAQVPMAERSISDALQCGKCKEKKVSYSQAQTRSADEPMTTFCECTVCGNRWKFS